MNSGTTDADEPGPDMEFVGLEKLDPEADVSEVQELASTDPGLDSPADNAVLEQEEFMEGLASDSLPSQHLDKN
ncbi:MAG TPA: hypothetical protein VK786_03160 [bacterium]|nr:hypothetical protein [bacterium]